VELRRILEAAGLERVELIGLDHYPDVPDVAETGATFEANALLKARAVARATGEVTVADSMLRNAPHTAKALAGKWEYLYDRSDAAFPVGVAAGDKYWPPVSRIDGAYGDRNLVCSCPPPEAFEA